MKLEFFILLKKKSFDGLPLHVLSICNKQQYMVMDCFSKIKKHKRIESFYVCPDVQTRFFFDLTPEC